MLAVTDKLGLEFRKSLVRGGLERDSRRGRRKGQTDESWGNNVTNAMNNSHPAFRLMGFEDLSLRAWAPSLRALESSNMVSAELVGLPGGVGLG